MAVVTDALPAPAPVSRSPTWLRIRQALRRHPSALLGALMLLLLIFMALLAPFLGTVDPQAISPVRRLREPSEMYWFGTDMLGRDVYSRVIYGARVSLAVGLSVGALATTIGLAIGLVTGFVRWLDAVVMRVMDGLMSIPGVLLAIALIALTKASLENVIIAITVTEVPRVVRLIRSLVLGLREQPLSTRPSPLAPVPRASSHVTSCPTRSRRSWCRVPISAPPPCSPRPSCRSLAPAPRPTFRAGATSWRRHARCFRSPTI